MTPRERFYACLRREKLDRIPLLAYQFLLPRGTIERRIQEAGCAIVVGVPIYEIVFPGEIEIRERQFWENGEKITVRRYTTPIGSVEEKIKIDPYGSEWKKEHLIKDSRDYETMTYLLEKVKFREQIEYFTEVDRDLGEDGIPVPMLPFFERSPFQKFLIDLAGPERALLDLYDQPQRVEDFLACLHAKLEEAMKIYELLPEKRLFWWVDNVTSDFTTPSLFQRFCLPVYRRYFPRFQQQGIFCMVHLDGKLNALKEFIREAPIDMIESFTLPEQGGDISFEEAQKVWPKKVIGANMPANLAYHTAEEVEKFLGDLISSGFARGNFILELSEDLPRKNLGEILSILLKVLMKGENGS